MSIIYFAPLTNQNELSMIPKRVLINLNQGFQKAKGLNIIFIRHYRLFLLKKNL